LTGCTKITILMRFDFQLKHDFDFDFDDRNISSNIVSTSVNGWMNEELTKDYLRRVIGKLSFKQRILVWDAYRCHISEATKSELKRGYNITTAVIPGGCTKYLQAADVLE